MAGPISPENIPPAEPERGRFFPPGVEDPENGCVAGVCAAAAGRKDPMRYDPAIHRRRSIRLKGYDYSQNGARCAMV